MEYCPYGNLEEWASRNEGKDIIEMFLQACSAIEYAHMKNKLHRDIKPDNILIGMDDLVKVTDFGLAYEVDRPTTPLTENGRGLGTPLFMAPEQFHGAKNVKSQADVYSLAMTLFLILTGELPFASLSRPPVRYEIPEGIEDELFTIISKGLIQNPEKRISTVTKFANSIRSLLSHETKPNTELTLPKSFEEIFDIRRKISNDEISVLRNIRDGEEIKAQYSYGGGYGSEPEVEDYSGPYLELKSLGNFGLITANIASDQEYGVHEGWTAFSDVAITEKGLALLDLLDIHLKEIKKTTTKGKSSDKKIKE